MIYEVNRTHSNITIDKDQNWTKYTRQGVDSVTFAWTSVCPYTGKEDTQSKTYTFNGKDEWVSN